MQRRAVRAQCVHADTHTPRCVGRTCVRRAKPHAPIECPKHPTYDVRKARRAPLASRSRALDAAALHVFKTRLTACTCLRGGNSVQLQLHAGYPRRAGRRCGRAWRRHDQCNVSCSGPPSFPVWVHVQTPLRRCVSGRCSSAGGRRAASRAIHASCMTAAASLPPLLSRITRETQAVATFLAKADGVLAGLGLADMVLEEVDPSVTVRYIQRVPNQHTALHAMSFNANMHVVACTASAAEHLWLMRTPSSRVWVACHPMWVAGCATAVIGFQDWVVIPSSY